MKLEVDGQEYEVDLAKESELFAKATPQARAHFEISSSGYGIHWPEIDEDLSIDGLIGVRHSFPLWESSR
ncbi:MAG: DUF2442 domain-containing protein [Candidatus Hydrogenedentes bacterium]|nr:DUF2442 domain-containing protein [Candidatus Hydrogenedentota bacterium]